MFSRLRTIPVSCKPAWTLVSSSPLAPANIVANRTRRHAFHSDSTVKVIPEANYNVVFDIDGVLIKVRLVAPANSLSLCIHLSHFPLRWLSRVLLFTNFSQSSNPSTPFFLANPLSLLPLTNREVKSCHKRVAPWDSCNRRFFFMSRT